MIAPGSSANLGPGFDTLGVALGRYVEAGNTGEGHPCDEHSIITKAYAAAGGTGDIWFRHNLEPGRGLGFSAAARAVGAAVGLMEQGQSLQECRDEAFRICTQLEGHADNAAPAVYGGFTAVCGNRVRRMKITSVTKLLLWIASESSSTDKSRKAIPQELQLCDAVQNIANTASLVSCLYEGDLENIGGFCADLIHQDRRFEATPDSGKAFHAGIDAGAYGGWLSGAGPSVAFVVSDRQLEQVMAALPNTGLAVYMDVDISGLTEGSIPT